MADPHAPAPAPGPLPDAQAGATSEPVQLRKSGPFTVFLTGVQFLLISPALIKRPFTPYELGAATAYYPLIGALLGGLLVGADALLGLFLPVGLRSALLLAAWVILTGALHLDGFLDSCDGLLGGFTPEQRMEIMRDERVGGYALAGGVLLLLIQFSALGALSELRWPALLMAPVLGRWSMTNSIFFYPYARPKGLGRDVKDNVRLPQVVMAGLLAGSITFLVALVSGSHAPATALVVALLTWQLTVVFILKRIPGLTGDSYGAINTLVETSVLIAMVAAQMIG